MRTLWRRLSLIQRSLLAVIPILFLSACLQRYDELLPKNIQVVWNPTLSAPLVNTTITLADLLSEFDTAGTLITNSDGVLEVVLSESIISDPGSSLYTIPNQRFVQTVEVPIGVSTPFPVDTTIQFTERYVFDVDTDQGELLDSITLNSGELLTDLTINFPPDSAHIQLIMESITTGGTDTLEQVFSFRNPGTSTALTDNSNSDVSGGTIDFTDGGDTVNRFAFTAVVTLVYENSPINSNTNASIGFSLNNLNFRGVFGDLSSRALPATTGDVPLGIFDEIDAGAFRLSEPSFTLDFENEFGLPVGIDFSTITAIDRDGNRTPLSGPITESLQVLDAPGLSDIGSAVNTTIVIDETNSNLPDVLASLPSRFEYDVQGTINPNGNSDNFVLDSSRVRAALTVNLPLAGSIQDLSYVTSFETSLDSITIDFESAMLILKTENGLPLDVDLQVFFFDGDSVLLDSLFTDNRDLVLAASVDAQGNVIEPASSTKSVITDPDQLSALSRTRFITIDASVSTSAGGTTAVRLKPEYGLNVRLGITTEFEVTRDISLTGGN